MQCTGSSDAQYYKLALLAKVHDMLQINNLKGKFNKVCQGPALQTSFDSCSAAKPPLVRSILLPRKHPIPGTCTGQLLSWIRSNFVLAAWQSRRQLTNKMGGDAVVELSGKKTRSRMSDE